jgi:fibronectin type 3 domain-containing protein
MKQMKIAIKITALAAALVLTAISCAPEVELTGRDWGAKTADLDSTKLDIDTWASTTYKPSVPNTAYDDAKGIDIFFPDAADVLRADNATIEGKLKEFMTFYTYSKVGQNYPDMLGMSMDYVIVSDNGFMKRLPVNGGELITVRLRSYFSSNIVIKIDADKYTFASGKKLGGSDDIKPGTPYYDLYFSLQVPGASSNTFVKPYHLNTLNITFIEDSATTTSMTRATVATLTIPGAAGLTSQEEINVKGQFLQGLFGKLQLQKYGNNGWENIVGNFSYDGANQRMVVDFAHEEFTLYRIEATGVNDLPVRYLGNEQWVNVRGSGGNMNHGYNRSSVVSAVYIWKDTSRRNYVTSTPSLFHGSEWVTVDRDGKNAVLRVWFRALNIPGSSTDYYLGQMPLADFKKNARIVFRDNGATLSSGNLGNADDICYVDINDIRYDHTFSSNSLDTLTITLDPDFSVKAFDNGSVYFLLSPGFKYESDNIVLGNYYNWNYEIDGVKFFDVYSLPFGSGSAPLSAPAGLNATAQSSTGIYLTWNSVSGASQYTIYRSISSSGAYSQAATSASSYFTDEGLSPDITYYYKVAAVDSGGEGAQSSVVSAKTQAITSPPGGNVVGATTLSVTEMTTDSVSLNWIVVPNVSRYHIYRSESSNGPFDNPVAIDVYGSSYTDYDVRPGRTYYYQLKSVGSNGYIGNPSNIDSATTQGGGLPTGPSEPLYAPTGLNVTGTTSSSVYLSWNSVSTADSYLIYRSSSAYGFYENVGYSYSAYYNDTGLSTNTTYYYYVTAYNSFLDPSESDDSDYVSATTQDDVSVGIISLSNGVWTNGEITSSTPNSEVWYTMSVASGTNYYIWWNDGYEGNSTKSLDIKVTARYNSTTGSEIFTDVDSGWDGAQGFTAGSTGTVYVRVRPYDGNSYSFGTYGIVYSTDDSRPVIGSAIANGTFTLTGIPSMYNGMYACFFQYGDVYIIGGESVDESGYTATASPISNGSVNIPVWMLEGEYATGYFGNHTFYEFYVEIINDETYNSASEFVTGISFESVTFSNGSATRSWAQGDVDEVD